jgi:hypothetical protein
MISNGYVSEFFHAQRGGPQGCPLSTLLFVIVAEMFGQAIGKCPEEVGQEISELSRELPTNEIALFSIVLSAEFGQKNLHSTENKSRKNINIKIFLQNSKCSSTIDKDLVISAKISEVNVIFNVILMFEISRLPATCRVKSKYVYNV